MGLGEDGAVGFEGEDEDQDQELLNDNATHVDM